MDFEKEIRALRADLNDLKNLHDLRGREMELITGPVVQSRWIRWDPTNETSVEQMKVALGDSYFNHGGLLRIEVGGHLVHVPAGTDVLFEHPRWNATKTWPEVGGE